MFDFAKIFKVLDEWGPVLRLLIEKISAQTEAQHLATAAMKEQSAKIEALLSKNSEA